MEVPYSGAHKHNYIHVFVAARQICASLNGDKILVRRHSNAQNKELRQPLNFISLECLDHDKEKIIERNL